MCDYVDSSTQIRVYELCKNGKSLFDSFVKEIENDIQLFDKLAGAIRIVEETANLNRYPKSKFREI